MSNKDGWHTYKEEKPIEEKEYLITERGSWYKDDDEVKYRTIRILRWVNDLYEVDDDDDYFSGKKGISGFIKYDNEYGYIHITDEEILAWRELPEVYKGN